MIFYGTTLRGKVDASPSGFVATRFVHVLFLPVIPLGSYRVTDNRWMSFRGTPIALNGRSVAAAYMRWWGWAFWFIPTAISFLPFINGSALTATRSEATVGKDAIQGFVKGIDLGGRLKPHLYDYVQRTRIAREPREPSIDSIAAESGIPRDHVATFFQSVDEEHDKAEATGEATIETMLRMQPFSGELGQRLQAGEDLASICQSIAQKAGVTAVQAKAWETLISSQFAGNA